jgi:hypothetical protein
LGSATASAILFLRETGADEIQIALLELAGNRSSGATPAG